MDPRIDILGLTKEDLAEEARRRIPEAAGAAREVYAQAMATGIFSPDRAGLGPAKAARWQGTFRASLPKILEVTTEAGEDGTTAKALLELGDGERIECVLIPEASGGEDPGRATLCVSSQVGCARACAFCETGRGGLQRSLSAGEIVGQVLAARLRLGWPFRNLVFMGMGEPLDNLEAVLQGIEVLRAPAGLGLGQDRISLCTAGNVEGIDRLARRPRPRIRLSVSLNAAEDGLRSRLMPINRTWPLAELGAALARYAEGGGGTIMLNYCLIPGLNDGEGQARAVAAFGNRLGAARFRLNLIPYNPGPRPLGRAPTEAEVEAFQGFLRAEGLPVRIRMPRGRSIQAACGQLRARGAPPRPSDLTN